MKSLINNKYILAVFALILFGAALFTDRQLSEPDYSSAVLEFQKVLLKKEKKLISLLDDIARQSDTAEGELSRDETIPTHGSGMHAWSHLYIPYFSGLYDNDGIIILIYDNDTLRFWSDNAAPVEHTLSESGIEEGLLRLNNGWYEAITVKGGESRSTGKTIIGLLLLKNDYPYQNQYLLNSFHKDFNLPSGCKLINSRTEQGNAFPVNSADGNYLGTLIFKNSQPAPGLAYSFALLFYFLSFIFLIVYIKNECLGLSGSIGIHLSTLLFVCIILSLRYLTILNEFPQPVYWLPLFSPDYYATSFLFPSLGDFLINSILIFYLSYFIYKNIPVGKTNSISSAWFGSSAKLTDLSAHQPTLTTSNPVFSIISICLGLLFIFCLSLPINVLFEGLIINSNISFNLNNLFELTLYSLAGFAAICLLFFSLFFIADKIVSVIVSVSLSVRKLILCFAINAGLFALGCYLFGIYGPILVVWPCAFVFVIGIAKISRKGIYTFSHVIFLAVIIAFVSTQILSEHTVMKEKANRKFLAEKLVVEQDPIAVYLFKNIENKIINDSIIRRHLSALPKAQDTLIKYITEKFLKGYWEKYDAQITICKPNDSLLIQPDNIVTECRLLFKGMITEHGESTISSRFYFLNNNNGRISYLAKLLFPKADIFIEFNSKFIPEELGYPELLLDWKVSQNIMSDIKNYSYARYEDGKLVSHSGEFHYNITDKVYGNANSEFSFIALEGFNHLVYTIDEDTSVILSKKEETFMGAIIRFSYLFAFFCLAILIMAFFRKLPINFRVMHLDFKRRIEASMMLILLAALLPIGIATMYYIKNQYNTRNYDNIHEKTHSVLIEVEHKLAGMTELTENMHEYLSFILTKFSYVFFTDINLYDLRGNLLASSRPEIFEEGLLGKKINAVAFHQLMVSGKTEFIHNECIGKLNYLSAYVPFRNEDNKLLAYLNLPYFAKQGELEKEISAFLVALINIYVLLIILAIIVALFLSNRITQPLRLIGERIGKIKLGRANEPIEWKSGDEIGNLVGEYNRMIAELEKSAGLLARSERESAWREMAKQVAHEIKNPLTPMKLSVQHLEKAWNDKAPDWEKRLQQFTQTLTQQIDALSSIAGGFSDFARMPGAKSEAVCLNKVIANVIDLYKDTKDVKISFRAYEKDYMVFADKEQLLQVLNNLLKNAIQAIPEHKEGAIGIELSEGENDYTVKITDNGIGISEGQRDKIFTPNFTTKTGGMGLGLAIVKNIVENSGGGVWFKSDEGIGSAFYFSLPKFVK